MTGAVRACGIPATVRKPGVSRRWLVTACAVSAICLALVGVPRLQESIRRVQFWLTGHVRIDGLTYYLNPADEHLTEIVLREGVWEPEETKVWRNRIRPGDTVVDVGANVGWYTVIASQIVGPQGRVIAFEPDPTNFALLQRTVAANGCDNVILEQKALSNQPGRLRLFLDKHNKGMHSTALQLGESAGVVDVDAVRLDDYMQRCGGEVHVVKIDVEGAEGFVLDGMSRVLQANPRLSLLIEYAPERLRATGYDAGRLLSGLESQGFRTSSVNSITRRVTPTNAASILGQLADMNLIYVNLLLERAALAATPTHVP